MRRRPPVPDELYEENKELPAEGMMFVAAKNWGVKNYFVEMGPETFMETASYIRQL